MLHALNPMEAHMLRLCTMLAAAALALPVQADEREIQYLKPKGLLNVPSFSQVTTASDGKLVFVSGQVSWDEKGKPLPYVRLHLVFDDKGQPAEQHLVEMPAKKVLARLIIKSDGSIRVLDEKDKELLSRQAASTWDPSSAGFQTS